MVTLYANVNSTVQSIPAEIQSLTQDIEVDFGSSILNVFSPTAKIEMM